MKKKILASAALVLSLLLLAGCLKYETPFDFISDGTTAPIAGTTDPFAVIPTSPAYEQPSTLPAVTDPAAPTAETTTLPGVTQAPQPTRPGIVVPANNEYDILRSGNFTMQATMYTGNEEQAMNMSVSSSGDLYMQAEFSGLNMGILIKSGKMYMLYPPEKKYLELNSLVTGILKIDPEEFTSAAKELGFEQMHPLSEATSAEASTFRGNPCTCFHMSYPDGTGANVYLAGTKLLGVENLAANGAVESTLVVTSISSGFPAMPPADYTKSGYMDFFRILYNNMDMED